MLVSHCLPSVEQLEKNQRYYFLTIPLQAWTGPDGSRKLRLPRFQDNRHMKMVRFSTLRTGRLYPQESFLVLISVRVWVDPRVKDTIVQWNLCYPTSVQWDDFTTFIPTTAQYFKQNRHSHSAILITVSAYFRPSSGTYSTK